MMLTVRLWPVTRVDAIEQVIREGRARKVPSRQIAEQIVALPEDTSWAKAVAHPLRAHILRLLREGSLSPARAAERLEHASLGAVAYHFRTLERLGMIEVTGQRQRRGAIEHIYSLKAR
jgi:DNA-binding transcriptional ArsR family regulator